MQTVKTYINSFILVAPLDWGLGHATRIIPIVHELLAQGQQVCLAASGPQYKLLQEVFPELLLLEIPPYNIQYPEKGKNFGVKVLSQAGKISRIIKKEYDWLNAIIEKYPIKAVISDNRYGLYNEKIQSIFITHQLRPLSPFGRWSDGLAQRLLYRYINQFNECWVPDYIVNGLAGILAHPQKLPAIPVKYIGTLSRLIKTAVVREKDHLFISLSGPEPQRSMLEAIVLRELASYSGTAVVVRGLPAAIELPGSTMPHVQWFNHLSPEEYGRQAQRAEFVISRSGYSTIMDMAVLEQQVIYIPTPGQTEQEYLAQSLAEKKIACYLSQQEFSISKALALVKDACLSWPEKSKNDLLPVIQHWLKNKC